MQSPEGFTPDRGGQRGEARPPRQRVAAGASHVYPVPRPTDTALQRTEWAWKALRKPVRQEGNVPSFLGPVGAWAKVLEHRMGVKDPGIR